MVMSDATNVGVAFHAEMDRKGLNSYDGADGIFGGLTAGSGPDGVLRNFPWRRLQALAIGHC
jgi:hypothetical protein